MSGSNIVVIDYGRGNLFSMGQALRQIGANFEISADPAALAGASHIVFPGVGAFGDAMDGLRQRGFVDALREAVAAGTPLLGVCVGCQLLLARGEEFGAHDGLGLIDGTVARLPSGDERIPNVGWRRIEADAADPVFGPLGDAMMYFVHSYAPRPADPAHVAATLSFNGEDVPVAVRAGNLLGVQFHPEKSGRAGLALLDRFVRLTDQ